MVKRRDLAGIIIAFSLVLALVVISPSDIPNSVYLGGFAVLAVWGLVDAWRRGYWKRLAVGLLFFIPFVVLLTFLPGDPDSSVPLPWRVAAIVVPLGILLVLGSRTGFFKTLRESLTPKRRPKFCEACAKSSEYTHFLDETWRSRYEGKALYLCLDCLGQSLRTRLSELRNSCIVAEPVAEPRVLGTASNAYYAYTNSDEDVDLASGAADMEDRRQARKALEILLAGANGICTACRDGSGNLLWVPAAHFKGKWTEFHLPSLAKLGEPGLPMCAACVTERIVEAIKSRKLRLDELWPPVEGTVLMFSGEA